MSEPNERDYERAHMTIDGLADSESVICDENIELLARDFAAYREELESRLTPSATGQDEALEEAFDNWVEGRGHTISLFDAFVAGAALRARQPSECDSCGDPLGACGSRIYHFCAICAEEGRIAGTVARPSSPQGDDDAKCLEEAYEFARRLQGWTQSGYGPHTSEMAHMIMDRDRAREPPAPADMNGVGAQNADDLLSLLICAADAGSGIRLDYEEVEILLGSWPNAARPSSPQGEGDKDAQIIRDYLWFCAPDLKNKDWEAAFDAIGRLRARLAASAKDEERTALPREMIRELVILDIEKRPLRECHSWPGAEAIIEKYGYEIGKE